MSTRKHTPGPWRLFAGGKIKPWAQIRAPHEDGNHERIVTDTTGWSQDYHESTANAERIVACVNACDGIEDPNVIPELVAFVRGFDGTDFDTDEAYGRWCQMLVKIGGKSNE